MDIQYKRANLEANLSLYCQVMLILVLQSLNQIFAFSNSIIMFITRIEIIKGDLIESTFTGFLMTFDHVYPFLLGSTKNFICTGTFTNIYFTR